MYAKNAASPAPIYATVVDNDGAPITADVVVYHIQGTERVAGAGTPTHVANGKWAYVPTQAETNYDAFAVEFYHTDAVGCGPIVEVATDRGIAFAESDEVTDAVAALAGVDGDTLKTLSDQLDAATTPKNLSTEGTNLTSE